MPEFEKLLHFEVPEARDIKAYVVRTKEGKILVRTEEELHEMEKEKGASPEQG